MLRGDQDHINSISDIIEFSKRSMRIFKLKQMQNIPEKRKKLSLNLIDEICNMYQCEFGANPFEIANGIQISGNLYYKKYHLSPI
jgi:hypothetical protein